MTGSTSAQTLTINGAGFANGPALKVLIGYAGGPTTTLTGTQIAYIGSTQILAAINVGVTARTWTVQVVNPNGLASASASLPVVSPPAIASLTPNPLSRSTAAQTLTINGSGFQAGSGLRVLLSAAGVSTIVQGTAIQSATSGQIKVTVNVGGTARTWTVQVLNPTGPASNAAALTVK
jgi:hypothetical protein